MNYFLQGYRSSFLPLVHLSNKKLHGSIGYFIDLLAYCAGWYDCFAGYRRIIESYNAVIIRQVAVLSDQTVDQHIRISIICKKNPLFSAPIVLIQRWRESGGKSSNMFYLKKADTR